MIREKFVSVRINEEFQEELNEVLDAMDSKFGFSSSRSWKIRWLLSLGVEEFRQKDLIFSGK